jgi:indoleacetamide hydrolase
MGWPGNGIAPISHTFDTPGPIARSVEDCALLDAIVTSGSFPSASKLAGSLKGVRFGLAPRQFLDLIDTDVERTFLETIDKLKAAGVEFVELDLGEDFATLAEQANWPVFFHETMPHVTGYLREIGAPVTFRDVFEGLGSNLKGLWGDAVVPEGSDYVSEAAYREALDVHRPALRKRYADAFSANGIEALLFPPCRSSLPHWPRAKRSPSPGAQCLRSTSQRTCSRRAALRFPASPCRWGFRPMACRWG